MINGVVTTTAVTLGTRSYDVITLVVPTDEVWEIVALNYEVTDCGSVEMWLMYNEQPIMQFNKEWRSKYSIINQKVSGGQTVILRLKTLINIADTCMACLIFNRFKRG